ncbi:MAG: hypothetical protein AAGD32_06885 [Planctomycetota bacterium]
MADTENVEADVVRTDGDPFDASAKAVPHLPMLAADIRVLRTHYRATASGPPTIVRLDVSYVLGLLSRRRIRYATVELPASDS